MMVKAFEKSIIRHLLNFLINAHKLLAEQQMSVHQHLLQLTMRETFLLVIDVEKIYILEYVSTQ